MASCSTTFATLPVERDAPLAPEREALAPLERDFPAVDDLVLADLAAVDFEGVRFVERLCRPDLELALDPRELPDDDRFGAGIAVSLLL